MRCVIISANIKEKFNHPCSASAASAASAVFKVAVVCLLKPVAC